MLPMSASTNSQLLNPKKRKIGIEYNSGETDITSHKPRLAKADDVEEEPGIVVGDGDYELDDEYSDEPSKFGSQALPVADLPDDYSGTPMDGMSYLFTVRRDAKALPRVARVDNPFRASPPPAPVIQMKISGPNRARLPPGTVPSPEWRASFEERFSALRQIVQLRKESGGHLEKPGGHPKPKDRDGWWKFINGDKKISDMLSTGRFATSYPQAASHVEVRSKPLIEDPAATTSVLKGVKDAVKEAEVESEGEEDESDEDDEGDLGDDLSVFIQKTGIIETHAENPTRASHQSSNQLLLSPSLPKTIQPTKTAPAPLPHKLEPAKSKRAGAPDAGPPRPPSTSLIVNLDHKTTYHLLMFFAHWIQKCLDDAEAVEPPLPVLALTDNDAKWIFSLLTHMDTSLTSDEISTLRNLARLCAELVKRALEAGEEVVEGGESCWMVVAAVTSAWGQRDLWDDAISRLTT